MQRATLILLACFLLATPLQFIDFVSMGGLGALWKLVSFALIATGTIIYWRAWQRQKRKDQGS